MNTINDFLYTGSTSTNDITYVDKKESSELAFDDFLNLMISQLQNQDFTNPVNDSEYMTQIAQMSMISQMEDIAKYTQNSYASSLLGKVVSVSDTSSNGAVKTDTGYVDKISFSGDELTFYVNNAQYNMSNIVHVMDPTYYELQRANSASTDTTTTTDE